MQEQLPAPVLIDPAPIDLPRASIVRVGRRMTRMSAAATTHFAPVAVRALLRREAAAARAARQMFERLGATYIKFGQFVASAPGIVGEQVAAEFRGCLDTGPPAAFAHVRAAVEDAAGAPLATVFRDFDEKPIAAASIAVVHRGRTRDGRDVAVKVLRPGIEHVVATDLALLERFARFTAARGFDQGYNMVSMVVGLRMQIAEELDLRNEARTMDTFRALFQRFGLDRLVVPHAYPAVSSRRVLAMDYIDGAPIDDAAHAARHGVDPRPLVRELLNAWVLTALRAGAFHADIHAGNLLATPDGRLAMLDWGIVSRLDRDTYRLFRAICEVAAGDERSWDTVIDVILAVNGATLVNIGLTDAQSRHMVRQLFEPLLTRPLSEVSMGEFLLTGDSVVRLATGEAPPRQSLRDRWRSMRRAARAYREADANGVFEHPTSRMGILSIKQLVYLERYGRMYIPDERLLGDAAFLRSVLYDEAPVP